jgi:tRNA pseudouridine13 synthase
MLSMTSDLAYLTADVPGIGGVIKQRPEDFLVDEQPLYQPCGSGEHLYIFIQKRLQTTTDVVRRLAKVFNVNQSDIGYAGMKDKQAVCRQHFSIRLPDPTDDANLLAQIDHTNLTMLWAQRHTNKLRRGHLAGNRFVIYIRQVEPATVLRSREVMERLARSGVPNFIGEQRFGYRQNNHILGKLLLRGQWQALLDQMLGDPCAGDVPVTRAGREAYQRGEFTAALESWPRHLRHERRALDQLRQRWTPEQVVRGMDGVQRQFLVSSLQSALFNRVLDQRLRQGLLDRLLEGDLAYKHDSGAVFLVDADAAQRDNAPGGRMATREVSPSGPMWGGRMARSAGQVAQWESAALADFGLTEADFSADVAAQTEGSRRPMRTFIKDPDISAGADEHGPFLRLAFEMPRGSFATIVLREIMKPAFGGNNELPAMGGTDESNSKFQ